MLSIIIVFTGIVIDFLAVIFKIKNKIEVTVSKFLIILGIIVLICGIVVFVVNKKDENNINHVANVGSDEIDNPIEGNGEITESPINEQNEQEDIYELAIKHKEMGNYYEALVEFDKLTTDFLRYDLAMKEKKATLLSYIKEEFDKVAQYISDEDYDLAIGILKEMKNDRILIDDAEIAAQIQNKYNDVLELYAENVVKMAQSLFEEEKLVEAIRLLKKSQEICERNIQIKNKLSELEEVYRNQIIEESGRICENEGYESAIELITNGLLVLTNDQILESKRDEYKLAASHSGRKISIFDMEPFQGEGHWEKDYFVPFSDETDWLIDMYGNDFHKGYIANHYEEGEGEEVVYLLNGKYSKCEFEMAWPKAARGLVDSRAYVKFSNNGIPFFTSDEIKCGDEPMKFTVDVSDVEKLSIERIAINNKNAWMNVTIIYPYFDLIEK